MAIQRIISRTMAAALVVAFAGCTTGFSWWGNKQASNPMATSIAQQSTSSSFGAKQAAVSALTNPVDDGVRVTSKQEPVGPAIFVATARLHENRGDFDTAAAQYKKAIEIAPKHHLALVGLARLKDRQGKFEEAESLYLKAIEARPEIASVHNDLGLCRARRGQPHEGLASILRAVELEPSNKLYRNNASSLLIDLERTDEAFHHLAKAHGEPIAHYNLGHLLHKRDKTDQAIEQFTLAANKDPSLMQAKDMLARLGQSEEEEEVEVQQTQHLSPETQRIESPLGRPTRGEASEFQEVPAAADSPVRLPVRLPAVSPSESENSSEFIPSSSQDRTEFTGNALPS